jgi:hypothetical protein
MLVGIRAGFSARVRHYQFGRVKAVTSVSMTDGGSGLGNIVTAVAKIKGITGHGIYAVRIRGCLGVEVHG